MRRFLHILTLSGLLTVSTALPSRVDARRLGLVPSGDEGIVTELVRALEAQSEEVLILGASGVSTDASLRQAVARGCDVVLFASCLVTGYRIDAQLIDTADARRLATETVSGPSEQVFELIDQLGGRLARDLRALRLPQGTVAVLAFDNDAGAENTPFVSGLPQMLLTSLHQYPELTLVESHQMERGRETLSKPGATVGPVDAAELGRWLVGTGTPSK